MDAWLLTRVNQTWSTPWLDPWMVGLSTIGLAVCGLLTWQCWRRGAQDAGARRLAYALLLAQGAAVVGTLIFYGLADRSRPEGVRLILAAPPFPGYFSGHTAVATATAVVWALVHGWNRRTAAPVFLAAGIAYSRIYLGHHYPSDLVGGAIWGAGMAAAGYGLVYRAHSLRAAAGWLIWPQVALAAVVTQMAYMNLLPWNLLAWPYADKVLHLLLVGALAFWLNLWFDGWEIRVAALRAPAAVVLPFAVALADEIAQAYSPYRTFDLVDLSADLVGLLLFFYLSRWMPTLVSKWTKGSSVKNVSNAIRR